MNRWAILVSIAMLCGIGLSAYERGQLPSLLIWFGLVGAMCVLIHLDAGRRS